MEGKFNQSFLKLPSLSWVGPTIILDFCIIKIRWSCFLFLQSLAIFAFALLPARCCCRAPEPASWLRDGSHRGFLIHFRSCFSSPSSWEGHYMPARLVLCHQEWVPYLFSSQRKLKFFQCLEMWSLFSNIHKERRW